MAVSQQTTTKTKITPALRVATLVAVGIAVIGGAVLFAATRQSKTTSTVFACPKITDLPSPLAKRNPIDDELQGNLADGYSRQLIDLLRDPGLSSNANLRTQAQGLAVKRKAAFLKASLADPARALASALVPQDRATLASFTSGCVEQPVTIEGALLVAHADFVDGTSAVEYRLTTNTGEKLVLKPASTSGDLRSGSQVRVTGLRFDNLLLADDSPDTDNQTAYASTQGIEVTQPAVTTITGEQKVLVLYFDFNDTTPIQPCPGTPCLDQNKIYDQFMNPALPSTDQYFRQASYYVPGSPPQGVWFGGVNNPRAGEGKLGDIYPVTGAPYELAMSRSCDLNAVSQAVMARAEAVEGEAALDFTRYQRIMFIGFFAPCGFAGAAYLGPVPFPTPDGTVTLAPTWISRIYVDEQTISHEHGHNFGNHHANWLNCGTIPLGPSCTWTEYDDDYDVMGHEDGHFNALHKEVPGWLGPAPALHEIRTVTSSPGVYDLAPMASAAPGLKALKIQRRVSPAEYLYVEYRQPIGFDTGFPSNLYQGALLRIRTMSPNQPTGSDLFDATASSSSPANITTPVLTVGYTNPDTGQAGFVDPLTGTRIRVLSNTVTPDPNNSRLRVEVTLGQDLVPPVVAFVPPTPAASSTVSGTIDLAATATDNFGIIDHVTFTASGGQVSQTVTVTQPTAGSTYTAQLDTRHLPNGNVTMQAAATDAAGQTATTAIVVVNQNFDVNPPSVSIITPAPGAEVPSSSSVTVTADASDDAGIWKVEFRRDDGAFSVDYSPPYEWVRTHPLGPITVTARAYDFVGNTSEASVTFSVIDTSPPYYVSLRNPRTTLTGLVEISVYALDNSGVISLLELYQDGNPSPLAAVSSPQPSSGPGEQGTYPVPLDSRRLSNGDWPLYAKAYDGADNSAESLRVTVTVDNPPSPGPPPPSKKQELAP